MQKQAPLLSIQKQHCGQTSVVLRVISAFGFGGTNFHAVIENASGNKPRQSVMKSWPAELLVFRGDSSDDIKGLLKSVSSILENKTAALKDIAFSLSEYNKKPVQLAIVAENQADALNKVKLAFAGTEGKGIYPAKDLKGKVAFMFPGQGSQRVEMAGELFVAFPAMRKLLKSNPAYQQILFPNAVFDEISLKNQKERIKDTRLAQPLLGIVDLAIASLLRDFGINPDMVAGHSYGELPALCFANVFDEDQLVSLSEKRAKAILDSIEDDKGAMIAVNCPEEQLTKIVSEVNQIYPVNHNSPQQWVLAGTTPAIESLIEKLKEQKISYKRLEVACAFHSPILAKSKGLYENALKDISFYTQTIPVWSNTSASVYPSDADQIKERLTEHLIRPVRFSEQVQKMYESGARVFIEVGPGKVLTGLTKSILGKDELRLYTEEKDQNGINQLLNTFAAYLASGREIQLHKLFEDRDVKLLDLDKPELYRKSSSIWIVDGQMALPVNGKLPSHGALPITTPLKLMQTQRQPEPVQASGNAELMVQEYLNSVKYLVQAQRDVILGYLGHAPAVSAAMDLNGLQHSPASFDTNVRKEPAVEVFAKQPDVYLPVSETNVPKVKKDIKTLLMLVVSDKTGYPEEMLGLDMDLEADLSIDSIKRMEIIGELRNQLGGFDTSSKSEESIIEELASIKTLKLLLDWMSAHQQESEPAVVVIPLSSLSVTQDGVIEGWSQERIKTILLDAVSDKTGYPQEMLGLDMDLEADLSIDSIKRMEIIGELKDNIDGLIEIYNNKGEELVEKLASIKTLNGLINWIVNSLSEQKDSIEQITAGTGDEVVKVVLSEKISRLRFELTPLSANGGKVEDITAKHFAVTDDKGGLAIAIKNLLETKGAIVTIISENQSFESFDGLIILNVFASPERPTIIESFELIKKLDFERVKWVYTISDTQSMVSGDSDIKLLRHFQGYSGLLKSLDKEYENTKCRLVSITSKLSSEEIAAVTLSEIQNCDEPSEVIYNQKNRQILKLVPTQLPTGTKSDIVLDKKSVVLALGGAQGITSELLVHFSKDHPCHYVLVGRSADPRETGDHAYLALKTKEEIKKYLITQGELKTPAEIEKRTEGIHKSNQILTTIASLEKYGCTVSYHALDLRNEKELSTLITQLYEQYGRINGVIHGAGLLEDKLFYQKTVASFERVISTKVTPLRVLAEQLRSDVQFVILFSSVASVYGNRGQTDYAAANSVMDRYAWELKKKIKGKVISINWGPWKGTGMVSPSLEREYERRGIPLIPLRDGMETFVNELKYGTESQVLIMAE
ncbi:SDR family NAD(P)-dependent oxidoreductase [Dyadobacter frigoris]|uniref:SDR family NAD(P)-dependent oxidoreductase n=1 Tax=Dyadobacter frigoris TaxID=2576211 RepID=UPI001C6FFCAC|nr:SDR family NAD(P)-dependent oxidoreductase [Dyadobacter frigoris]